MRSVRRWANKRIAQFISSYFSEGVACEGVVDGINRVFYVPKHVIKVTGVFFAGARASPKDFILKGDHIIFTISPDHEYQRPVVDGIQIPGQ